MVEQLPGHRSAEGGHVLQEPPRLMCGARDPGPHLGIRVAVSLEQAVVDGLRTDVDEHFVEAVEREDVQLVFPIVPAVVRARVAVAGVVEGESVSHVGRALQGATKPGQPRGQVCPLAVPGEVGVRVAAQVLVESGELHGRMCCPPPGSVPSRRRLGRRRHRPWPEARGRRPGLDAGAEGAPEPSARHPWPPRVGRFPSRNWHAWHSHRRRSARRSRRVQRGSSDEPCPRGAPARETAREVIYPGRGS